VVTCIAGCNGTRLTDPRKLDLLMGLVALAIAWAARAARDLFGTR